MKKIKVVLSTIAACFALTTLSASASAPFYYDTNFDGVFSDDDIWEVINNLGGPYNPVYDMNLDGYLSPVDALILINFRNSYPWHNSSLPEDISGDGYVSPVDYLTLIHRYNAHGYGFYTLAEACQTTKPDADPNNEFTPLDFLLVIHYLNS